MSEGKSAATPKWAIRAMQRMHATVCPADCNDPECIAEVNRGAEYVAEEAALAGSVAAPKAQPGTKRIRLAEACEECAIQLGVASGLVGEWDNARAADLIYAYMRTLFNEVSEACAPKAGEPPQLSTWLDTTLWSFVHGALLDLGVRTSKECISKEQLVLHQHMRGAILAALQVGAGETPAERWIPVAEKIADFVHDYAELAGCSIGRPSPQVIARMILEASVPPGAGSTKENA